MLLMFDKKMVDTKGLPRIAAMSIHGSSDGATVYVLLESRTRAAVEKWAKRLGVEVTEDREFSANECEVSAEAKSDGNRLHVYTYVPTASADAAGGAS